MVVMIGHEERIARLLERQEDALGNASLGRAVTATLRVSPNGSGADGLSWRTAYQTIQAALDAASTDADDCTLILIAPHATQYDINTTGDPTWAANVILKGSHRNWTKIVNTHLSATSILKLTGKSAVEDLNFNLGTGNNGLILTHGGFRVDSCMFIGENLTSDKVALWIDGAATIQHGKIRECDFKGDGTNMTGILLDNVSCAEIKEVRIGFCASGVQVVNAGSTYNKFANMDVCSCAIGFNLDAGDYQQFDNVHFLGNTLNIDDEVGTHTYTRITGAFPMAVTPDDMTGITVSSAAGANTYGGDTELRAAASASVPFRVVAVYVDPNVAEWYNLRLSADSGSTFFDHIMVSTTRAAGSFAPSGTEYIFNTGTRISASVKAETAGPDTMKVWLKLQEI